MGGKYELEPHLKSKNMSHHKGNKFSSFLSSLPFESIETDFQSSSSIGWRRADSWPGQAYMLLSMAAPNCVSSLDESKEWCFQNTAGATM